MIKQKLDKMKEFLDSVIRKSYYYVGMCPRCKSCKTGRFIKYSNTTNTEWVINEALRNGELVEPVPELGKYNCFCAECQAIWYEDVKLMFLSKSKIKEEKEKRGTIFLLKERYDEMKAEEKKKTFFARFYGNFYGKI